MPSTPGIDIGEMAKRGYMDMYIAAPRWTTADFDIPIALWKQLLEPYNVEVVGGIDINIAARPDEYPVHISTYETYCALAAPEKDIEVYVNSTPVKFVKTKECGYPKLTEKTVYEFEIEKQALSEHSQVAEIIVNDGISIEIDYADIEIINK